MESELENWIEKVEPFNMSSRQADEEELAEVCMYKVV
jgi:hypothetical protein